MSRSIIAGYTALELRLVETPSSVSHPVAHLQVAPVEFFPENRGIVEQSVFMWETGTQDSILVDSNPNVDAEEDKYVRG
jgi:hypothetical protein